MYVIAILEFVESKTKKKPQWFLYCSEQITICYNKTTYPGDVFWPVLKYLYPKTLEVYDQATVVSYGYAVCHNLEKHSFI